MLRRHLGLVTLALVFGCGKSHDGKSTDAGDTTSDSSGDMSTGDSADCSFAVEPTALQTITVPVGTTSPTVVYTSMVACFPVVAAWNVDKGEIGNVVANPTDGTAVFTPTGRTGGLVTLSANLNSQTLKREIFVKLTDSQNGPNASVEEQGQIPATPGDLTSGGGVGGVGGDGLGTMVTDPATVTVLDGTPVDGSTVGLSWLYPYDKTVWPRGLHAPLMMWSWTTNDADAIKVELSTTLGSYSWTGIFGRPAILATTGGKFIHMPVPQDVWDTATNTASGKTDQLTVKLTVAKDGVAYGPISETWTIAPVRLDGTIYYQSYGTQQVQNFNGAVGGNGKFGAAVLSIRVGDTAPKVTAGTATLNSGCRVCHSVAAGGSRLTVVNGGNQALSSAYDLATSPATETGMTGLANYPAIYPDGNMALTAGGALMTLPNGTALPAPTGLSAVATNLGQPMFSPDGTKIAFNPLAGPAGTKVNKGLYVMNFDKATSAFTAPVLVADDTGLPAAVQPSWPAFLPDNQSLVYHQQTIKSIEDNLATRAGSHAQIYWTSGANAADATPLDALNGTGYLPKLATPSTMSCLADGYQVATGPSTKGPITNPDLDHGDDANLNYEPTVLPLGGAGYAWVIFTSRRLYGNEATIPPFCSDPRGVDLIQNITTKKLWVAAVDLSQAPGTDSSHPAFYLPAQELLAGNARAFWALDPCHADGATCTSGDQCCGGYCQPGTDGLVCGSNPTNMCSLVGDRCDTAAECCDATNVCLNGFCTQSVIN